MLCAACQNREATVHLTFIAGDTMGKRDLCLSCFDSRQFGGWEEGNSQLASQPLPPIDVEQMTALEYLEACKLSDPALLRIRTALRRFPDVRQRLAFELLPLVLDSLDSRMKRYELSSHYLFMIDAIEAKRLPEYARGLEKIIVRYIELSSPPGTSPLGKSLPSLWFLRFLTLTLRAVQPDRFPIFLAKLKRDFGASVKQGHLDAIFAVEQALAPASCVSQRN
jgi:hypothetical protein